MSNSSSPSTSSLIHQNRPAILSPQPAAGAAEVECPDVARRSTSRAHSPAGFKRLCSPNRSSAEINAIASASHGLAYLNVPPMVRGSSDKAEADQPSLPPAPQRQVAETLALLTTVKRTAIGEAIPREQWQPDGSSALCSYPLCTTNFGPAGNFSYFSLTPRRHHCRLCGHIYCGDHTTQRAHLIVRTDDGKRISKQRVCDVCLPSTDETPFSERDRRSSTWSEGSQSTVPSDTVMTPEDEIPHMSPYPTSPVFKLRANHRSHLDVTVLSTDDLAPVEPWMGAEGILSLYPLAVNASHASGAPAPCPAVGPLFAPSASARRTAQEKEFERMSRQRRLASERLDLVPESGNSSRSVSPAVTRSNSRNPLRTRSEERVHSAVSNGFPFQPIHM